MYSKFPSTIIDVQKRNVQQTSSLVEHPRQSYMVAVEELSQLYHDKVEACRQVFVLVASASLCIFLWNLFLVDNEFFIYL